MLTSTYTITSSLRRTLNLLQASLVKNQKEFSTGRYADPAISLGVRVSRIFTFVETQTSIDATLSANNITASRLDATQTALRALLDGAEEMRRTLISSQPSGGDVEALVSKANQALANLIANLNSSDAGGYIFGGVNSDQSPINDYFATPASSAKTALDSAFSATFGFPQSSGSVSGITSTQMEAFLSGAFESLFSSTNWQANWSTASDKVQRSQISLSAVIDTSVSSNEPALQQLAKAYNMLSDLGVDKLDDPAYAVVLKSATSALNNGIDSLMKTQARVGVMQNTVKNASDAMKLQKDTIAYQLLDLEGVDPIEAGAKVQNLLTQIETAYTLTARISQLTLTKYL